jgi:UDP-N-acetylmuramyl pentapeptide phosphotransferase/UDP-N-acetylglucosamine-1-phosphate transferase
MVTLTLSFLTLLFATLSILRYNHLHSRFTADDDFLGVQKFHVAVVPRVGGVGVILGLFLALLVSRYQSEKVGGVGIILLIAGFPAFFCGVIEDLTKKVGIKARLLLPLFLRVLLVFFWILGLVMCRFLV